jgi:hypothetical protein
MTTLTRKRVVASVDCVANPIQYPEGKRDFTGRPGRSLRTTCHAVALTKRPAWRW